MSLHRNFTGEKVHTPISFVYADETEREAADLSAGDVYKFALQIDNASLWILVDDDPLTWAPAGGAGDMLSTNNLSDLANKATARANLGIEAATADVASGSTTNIGAATSMNVRITGTTTITAFDTVAAGIVRHGYFAGVLTLTHNGTSLILPGAANITTAAGDAFDAISLGSGNWKVLIYQKADGTPIAGGGGGTTLKTVWSPDAPPASPSAYDSEFDAGSAGVPSGFTEYDPGSILAVDESSTYKKLIATITSATFAVVGGIYREIPAGDFTIWTKVRVVGKLADYSWAGLALWEDATDSAKGIENFCLVARGSAGPVGIDQFYMTNYNTYNTDRLGNNSQPYSAQEAYLRIRRNGTTYYIGWSENGEVWYEKNTATTIGFTPSHFGLSFANSTGVTNVATADFFRYVGSDVGLTGIMNGAAINLLA
jgi:hypothetical protein